MLRGILFAILLWAGAASADAGIFRGSYYDWGRAGNGNTYCYQYTSNGIPMNAGQPVSNYLCN